MLVLVLSIYVSIWAFSLLKAIHAFAAQLNILFDFCIYIYDLMLHIDATIFLCSNNTTCHSSVERFGNHDSGQRTSVGQLNVCAQII